MEPIIHIIVCGWQVPEKTLLRCMDSIYMQTFSNYRIHTSIPKNRVFLPENTYETIKGITPIDREDIIVCVDADDFLIDEEALQIIFDEYRMQPGLLLTYGSYVNLSSNKRGKFCGEYETGESFRDSLWRGSHLKTFKKKLWDVFPVEALKDNAGGWLPCCADRAMMVPMMEMAGYNRIKYIDWLLYCYDDTNPQSVWKTMRQTSLEIRKMLQLRPPYKRIELI